MKTIKLCNISIFRLALAFNEHGLKMPILTTTFFGPQFSFSQYFEQRNCSLHRFLYDTHFLTISFKRLHVFITVKRCSAINNLSIALALQLSKSGFCNLKFCVTVEACKKYFSLI